MMKSKLRNITNLHFKQSTLKFKIKSKGKIENNQNISLKEYQYKAFKNNLL